MEFLDILEDDSLSEHYQGAFKRKKNYCQRNY